MHNDHCQCHVICTCLNCRNRSHCNRFYCANSMSIASLSPGHTRPWVCSRHVIAPVQSFCTTQRANTSQGSWLTEGMSLHLRNSMLHVLDETGARVGQGMLGPHWHQCKTHCNTLTRLSQMFLMIMWKTMVMPFDLLCLFRFFAFCCLVNFLIFAL